MKYVIGIDPDSKKHGVATYCNGKLTRLDAMHLMELMAYLTNLMESCDFNDLIEFHIENILSVNAVYKDRMAARGNAAVHRKMSNSVGRCQQSQVEVERMIERIFNPDAIIKHKPSKMWKDQNGKKQFEKVTGWKGRSNEDTRSAAYFGWLGVSK